jgi:hypothetical protein
VITAFLFTAWLTFCVAAILGYYRLLKDIQKFKDRKKEKEPQSGTGQTQPNVDEVTEFRTMHSSQPAPLHQLQTADQPQTQNNRLQGVRYTTPDHGEPENEKSKVPRLKSAATEFLEPLCDLQLATGTAIVIAGLAQGRNLNFYHEQIISSYWNLTLNSFWAAQISNEKYDGINDLPSFVRTSAIWCSLILAIFFQSRQILHDYARHGYWNPVDGNRCFLLNHDKSGERQSWLWIVGLSIYALVLSMRLLRHVCTWIRLPVQHERKDSETNSTAEAEEAVDGGGKTALWIIGCLIRVSGCLVHVVSRFIHVLAGLHRILRKEAPAVNPHPPAEANCPSMQTQNKTNRTDILAFDFIHGTFSEFKRCLQEHGGCWLWLDWMLTWGHRIFSFEALDEWLVAENRRDRKHHGPWRRKCNSTIQWILRIFIFALTNFLAVWSFGSGSFGVETLAILGYLAWNTLDVIDAKVSNRHLVQNELAWGFGQVLPLILLGTFLFRALDVYQDGKGRKEGSSTKQQGNLPPSAGTV